MANLSCFQLYMLNYEWLRERAAQGDHTPNLELLKYVMIVQYTSAQLFLEEKVATL